MIEIDGRSFRLRLNHCGRVRCEQGWHLGPDWGLRLRDYDLWFVWAGRGKMRTNEGEFPLSPGTCFWMRPGRRYEATQDSAARLGVSFVHFELLTPSGKALPLSAFTPPVERISARQFAFVDTALRRVIEVRREQGGEEVAARLFAAVLADLFREPEPGEAGLERHHRETVQRATTRIREHAGASPDVATLAQEAGYSVDHFSRVFSKITGRRPQIYVIEAKLERARQLLSESSLTVGEIAEVLGYREIFFFSRQFRQHTGCSPTEFRRRLGLG
jgi:AraC-like DNA-binding protein